MTESAQERNKALVLQALDLLFNKRDYAAAEKHWSPHYIQHSAHIAPGRDGRIAQSRNRTERGELRGKMLELYPERINPGGALWLSARAAKS